MSGLGSAESRAKRLYPRSKGFRTAYMKGARAHVAGLSERACPYKVDPTRSWLVAWRKAWLRGHRSMGPSR